MSTSFQFWFISSCLLILVNILAVSAAQYNYKVHTGMESNCYSKYAKISPYPVATGKSLTECQTLCTHKTGCEAILMYKSSVESGKTTSCYMIKTNNIFNEGTCSWGNGNYNAYEKLKVMEVLPIEPVSAMTPFAIITFVIGQVQWFVGIATDKSGSNHKEVMEKLTEIKAITKATQKGVNSLIMSVDFVDQQIVLTQAQTKILSQFNRYVELNRLKASKTLWKTWAVEVTAGNGGTADQLSIINTQISNFNIIGKFKNKVEAHLDLKRTVAGSVVDFIKLQIIYQMVGFEILQEANKLLLRCINMNFEYKVMIQRFNKQIQATQTIAAKLVNEIQYLRNNAWASNYLNMKDQQYAHLEPVEADEGQVITGVQLYQFEPITNRFAIKIKQGKLNQFGAIVDETWKKPAKGNAYMRVYASGNHYIDLHKVSVPSGQAMVGVSFYKKGNRLAVKVKASTVDYRTGQVGPSGDWIYNKNWGNDYFNADTYHFVDLHPVETMPASLLTGFGLYKKGNRMAPQIRDVFSTSPDGTTCPGDYQDVKMFGNYKCCDGFPYTKDDKQSCPAGGQGPQYDDCKT